MKSKDCQRLFVAIFSVLLFLEDNQLKKMGGLKEGVVVQPLARRAFDLKVGGFLRHKSFLHIVSPHSAVYKWIVSLDKARGTKVMQDRSSYEVCKNEL